MKASFNLSVAELYYLRLELDLSRSQYGARESGPMSRMANNLIVLRLNMNYYVINAMNFK